MSLHEVAVAMECLAMGSMVILGGILNSPELIAGSIATAIVVIPLSLLSINENNLKMPLVVVYCSLGIIIGFMTYNYAGGLYAAIYPCCGACCYIRARVPQV